MSMEPSNDDATRYSYIPFRLAKYALDGVFLGWENMTTQIFLCPMTEEHSRRFRRVGLGLVEKCEIDLEALVNQYIDLPNINYFYELYLVDYNDDLIDVPVLIDNYLDESDTYPNRLSSKDDWRLVRRFFLYENVSAIESGTFLEPNGTSTYARFIHEARFVYELDRDSDETIFVPYLHLFYRTIESDLVTDTFPADSLIVTQWKMNTSHADEIALGFFIAAHVLLVLYIFWRLYKWAVLHPQNYESSAFIYYLLVQVISETIENWSAFIFYFLF